MLRLQFIGGGNMGEALAEGLIGASWAEPEELSIIEKQSERRSYLKEKFPKCDIATEPHNETDAVLAVKPSDIAEALKSLRAKNISRLLSIAAGISTSVLEKGLSGGTHIVRVVRAMPNTLATVGFGAAAISGGTSAAEEDLKWADSILESVGVALRVEENLLDAITGLSGSGPAYVFYLAEALIRAGEEAGLDKETASRLVIQTLLGSAQMLSESGLSPEELRRRVTSPKGTTERGIGVLQDANMAEVFIEAVIKATERARELGEMGEQAERAE